ncbi:hypothetical protein QN277_011919 [Acacia crassicarpa]|uniref:Uncharacterized protein n=1 Tax=Acacia crassicarpa TaxID=499986 RepID=A0AAE1TCA5_9FABA|nr:hypothetical protein QN277_011919 [Acacia crassicarpa]
MPYFTGLHWRKQHIPSRFRRFLSRLPPPLHIQISNSNLKFSNSSFSLLFFWLGSNSFFSVKCRHSIKRLLVPSIGFSVLSVDEDEDEDDEDRSHLPVSTLPHLQSILIWFVSLSFYFPLFHGNYRCVVLFFFFFEREIEGGGRALTDWSLRSN